MALPTTVLAATGLAGHHPPYKSSGGAFYCVARADADELDVYKATDPTDSWAVQGTGPVHAGTILGYSTVQDGDVIYIVAWSATAYEYYTFNMATDAWVVDQAIETPTDAPTNPWASIAVRSDGTVVVVYAADTDQVMGGKKERVDYNIRSSGGTWGGAQALDNAGDVHYGNPNCVLGTNDMVHCLWQIQTSTANDPPISWASSQGTTIDSADDGLESAHGSGTANPDTSTADTGTTLTGFTVLVAYDDAGTQKFTASGSAATGTTLQTVQGFENGSDYLTFTATGRTETIKPMHSVANTFAALDADIHGLYSGGEIAPTSYDLYHLTSTDDGINWTNTIELGAQTIWWVSANVYVRGSATVLAYLYDNAGTQYYNEKIIKPDLQQDHYRLATPVTGGTHEAWTLVGSEDTSFAVNLDAGNALIIKIGNDGSDLTSGVFQLEYDIDGSTIWNDVNAASSNVRVYASGDTDDATSATERLTSSPSRNFDGSKLDEGNGAITYTLANAEEVELYYSIVFRSADLGGDESITFRVTETTETVNYDITPTFTIADASFVQEHFRWTNNNAVSHETWSLLGTEDEAFRYLAPGADYGLILKLGNDGSTANSATQLQYNYNSTGWSNVTASSSYIKSSDSGDTDNATSSTERLSTTSRTFIGTKLDEVDGALTQSIGFDTDYELYYSIEAILADVYGNDVIDFRLTNPDDASITYTNSPQARFVISSLAAGHYQWMYPTTGGAHESWPLVGSEDTSYEVNTDVNYGLIIKILNLANASHPDIQLRYRVDGGSYAEVNASSSNVRSVDSGDSDGATSSTERLTTVAQPFIGTNLDEVDGIVSQSVGADTSYEIYYSLVFRSADLSGGETIEFSLSNFSDPTVLISPLPTATIASAGDVPASITFASTHDQAHIHQLTGLAAESFLTNLSQAQSNVKTVAISQTFDLTLDQLQVYSVLLTEAATFDLTLDQIETVNKITSNAQTFGITLDEAQQLNKITSEIESFDLVLDETNLVNKITAVSQAFGLTLDQLQVLSLLLSEVATFGLTLDQIETVNKISSNAQSFGITLDEAQQLNKITSEIESFDLVLDETNLVNKITSASQTFGLTLDQLQIYGALVSEAATFSLTLDQIETVTKITTNAQTFGITLDEVQQLNKITSEIESFDLVLDETNLVIKIIDVSQTFGLTLDQLQIYDGLVREAAITLDLTLDQIETINRITYNAQTFGITLDEVQQLNRITSEIQSFDLVLDETNLVNKVTSVSQTFGLTLDQLQIYGALIAEAATFGLTLDQIETVTKITFNAQTFGITLDEVATLNRITSEIQSFDLVLDETNLVNKVTSASQTFGLTLDQLQIYGALVSEAATFGLTLDQIETVSRITYNAETFGITLGEAQQLNRITSEIQGFDLVLDETNLVNKITSASQTFGLTLNQLQIYGALVSEAATFGLTLDQIETISRITYNAQTLGITLGEAQQLNRITSEIESFDLVLDETNLVNKVTLEAENFDITLDMAQTSTADRLESFIAQLDLDQVETNQADRVESFLTALTLSQQQSNVKISEGLITFTADLDYQILKQLASNLNITLSTDLDVSLVIEGSGIVTAAIIFLANVDQTQTNIITANKAVTFAIEVAEQYGTQLDRLAAITLAIETLDTYISGRGLLENVSFGLTLDQIETINKIISKAQSFGITLDEAQQLNRITSEVQDFDLILDETNLVNKITGISQTFGLTLDQLHIISKFITDAVTFNTQMDQTQTNTLDKVLLMSFDTLLDKAISTQGSTWGTVINFATVLSTIFSTEGEVLASILYGIDLDENIINQSVIDKDISFNLDLVLSILNQLEVNPNIQFDLETTLGVSNIGSILNPEIIFNTGLGVEFTKQLIARAGINLDVELTQQEATFVLKLILKRLNITLVPEEIRVVKIFKEDRSSEN